MRLVCSVFVGQILLIAGGAIVGWGAGKGGSVVGGSLGTMLYEGLGLGNE